MYSQRVSTARDALLILATWPPWPDPASTQESSETAGVFLSDRAAAPGSTPDPGGRVHDTPLSKALPPQQAPSTAVQQCPHTNTHTTPSTDQHTTPGAIWTQSPSPLAHSTSSLQHCPSVLLAHWPPNMGTCTRPHRFHPSKRAAPLQYPDASSPGPLAPPS